MIDSPEFHEFLAKINGQFNIPRVTLEHAYIHQVGKSLVMKLRRQRLSIYIYTISDVLLKDKHLL